MIKSYIFSITPDDNHSVPAYAAYYIYSWLLGQMPEDYAAFLHEPGEKPVSQYIRNDHKSGKCIWTVNLLTDEAAENISPILDNINVIQLHTGCINAVTESVSSYDSIAEFIRTGRSVMLPRKRYTIQYHTPTAFKQAGKYVILPTTALILQSCINKWNFVAPEYPIDDGDAITMLENGLSIVDYSLRSARYPLKNVRIPGFIGNITIESSLPAPMQEIWILLFRFMQYSGTGIKTTLGMGGVETVG